MTKDERLNKTITTTSTVAKLLATDDITVEQRQLPTAYFDVKNRILGLPLWASDDKDVHDLLVGHEVGHALYTPVDFAKIVDQVDTENEKAVLSYHNVIEDIRIEKCIKSKFPGLKRNFYNGYQSLMESDFFGIKGKDTRSYGIIDRINIHYKGGGFTHVPFSDKEKPFLKLIDNSLETWDDTVRIVKALYEYSKNNEVDTLKEYDFDNVTSGESDKKTSGESDGSEKSAENSDKYEFSDGQDDSTNPSNPSSDSNKESRNVGQDTSDAHGGKPSASKTQENFDKELEKLGEDSYNYNDPPQYLNIPNVNSEDYIVDYKKVQTYLGNEFSNLFGERMYPEYKTQIDSDYKKFKTSTNKTVNYLVKEFELKKNAQLHVRAKTSKTGVIDTNRLHSYKINDDIFKRVTNLPEGKNHGLLFFFDLSGSMQNHIAPTIRQIINLVMFCDKVGIPFEVYGFTDTVEGIRRHSIENQHTSTIYKEKDIIVSPFALRNYASSKMRGKELSTALYQMYALSWLWDRHSSFVPRDEKLGSTPLNDAIIVAHDIIPKFRKQYGLEKVHVVFLTDGESNASDYTRDVTTNSGYNYINQLSKKVITDPITKLQYAYYSRTQSTSALLQSLQDRHQIKTIGFFICCGSYLARHLKYNEDVTNNFDNNDDLSTFVKKIRKEKFGILDKYGYEDYYIIVGGRELDTDSEEFEVDDNATKGKLTTAFKKHTKSKTMNRVLLTRFIDTIS